MSKKVHNPELDDLANHIGQFMRYWGFKSSYGAIWTHIYLAKEPVSTTYLIEKLQISKALVSLSLKELLLYELIEVSHKGSGGVQYYKAVEDVVSAIKKVIREREKRLISRIGSCASSLLDLSEEELSESNVDPLKVKSLSKMTSFADNLLKMILKLSDLKGL